MKAVETLHICCICGQATFQAVVCEHCRSEVIRAVEKSYEQEIWQWGGYHKLWRGLTAAYLFAVGLPGVMIHLPIQAQQTTFPVYIALLMVVFLIVGIYFWSQ